MSYVLKLCGWYPSEIDEFSGDFVQRHARSIATQVPVVVLFAVKDPGKATRRIRLAKRESPNLEEYIFYYPTKPFMDKWWSQWYYLKIIRHFLPMLLAEKGQPFVVHVNIAWKAAIWATFIRKRFNWPIVVTENSTEYQENAQLNIRTVSRFRIQLTRSLFQHATKIISVTRQLSKTVNGLFGNVPSYIVPNAVDTKLFKFCERNFTERFRIVHVSTLTYQKNPEGLVKVFEKVLSKIPVAEVEIIGPPAPIIDHWVKHSASSERIHITGLLPYPEVAKHLQAADLLVLFSRYENLPCVILEAFCSGVPVVSTAVGGIDEVVNDSNGILVKEGDEVALFDAICYMYEHRLKYDRPSIAETAASQFNFQAIGKGFMKAYNEAGIILPATHVVLQPS